MTRTPLLNYVLVATVALAAGAAGAWVALRDDAAPAATAERKVLYWHDPMVPGFRSDKPGRSPFMDMDLVPVYEGEDPNAPAVSIRPELANSLGVRTAAVVRRELIRTAAATGYIVRADGGAFMLADLFESNAGWIRAGLAAEIRSPDLPGRVWPGVVESVGADSDFGSRSLRARLRVRNPDAALTHNLFTEAVITGSAGKRLMIPRDALIRTGTRTSVVIAVGEGRFQPTDVTPGVASGDWIEIVRGLNEGDRVVTAGQFLIDAEANTRTSLERMTPDAK
jgi:membrane fusion protein, copper/silver efflux system